MTTLISKSLKNDFNTLQLNIFILFKTQQLIIYNTKFTI